MDIYSFDSINELLENYSIALSGEGGQESFTSATYKAQTDHGELTFRPVLEDGKGWAISMQLEGGRLDRSFDEVGPPPLETAEREILETVSRSRPSRHPEARRVINRLRELASQRREIDAEARRVALEAVAHGIKKVAVADAAKISRVTLDRWLRSRED